MGITTLSPAQTITRSNRSLVIDGLVGYSLRGDPRLETAGLIRWANESGNDILALDVPSGLEATTGQVMNPAIRPTATMTLALPKTGLRRTGVAGELYLADIGVPPELYSRPPLNLSVPNVFAESEIVLIDRC